MADEAKQIVIAPHVTGSSAPPVDWQDQIRDIVGIDVLGSAFGRMQVKATPKALDIARRKLGHFLHFEESQPRTISDGSIEGAERRRRS